MVCLFVMATIVHGQSETAITKQSSKLYHPEEEIAKAVKQAGIEKKQVLIQAGGNWCG